MKNLLLILILCLLSIQSSFAGDILLLNNQMLYEGKVKRIANCEVVFKMDGKKYRIPAEEIHTIKFYDERDRVYTDYLALNDSALNICYEGKHDAYYYHKKNGRHILLGFLFGPFAIAGTALATPSPQKAKGDIDNSKNKELFSDPEYLKCYQKKAKGQLIGKEVVGFAISIFVLSILSINGLVSVP